MKKILSVVLAGTMMLSLAACGAKEEAPVAPPNDTVINSSQGTTQPEEPTTEVETPTQTEDTTTEETPVPEEVPVPEGSTTPEIPVPIEPSEPTEEPEVNNASQVILAEGSSLNTSPEFNGLYRVNGYSRMAFGASIDFQIGMEGVNVDNNGEIDASKAPITDEIISLFDYVYFSLEFDGENISKWDIVDRKTNESVLGITKEEINDKYFPETKYEVVEAGELPETINLSDYEVGKMYAFDVPGDSFNIPTIINDTDYPMLFVSTKDWDGNFERTYKPKYFMPDTSSGTTFSDDNKYYMAVSEGDYSDVIGSEDCLLLDGYNVGDELAFDFEDFIGNNTDKTITLLVEDWGVEEEFTLLPGEVLGCSWMNDVIVTNIQ